MLYNIQILRFFAALAVVQYHVIDVLASYGFQQDFMELFKGWGASGVDLFFVISGFVLYRVVLTRDIGPVEFLRDRVTRIVPLYWFFTILMALALISFPEVTRSETFDPLRLIFSLFFLSGLAGHSFPVLGVGWTLEYEFFFYAVITFGLAIGLKGKLLPVAGAIFAALFFAGWGSTIFFEFLFGMLAATLTTGVWKGAGALWILLLGLALTIASVPLTGEGYDRALIYGLPSFLIVVALAVRSQVRQGFLTLLGDASFSIYLTHQPILSALGKILQRFFPNVNGDMAAFLVIVVLVLIGTVTYLIIERPIIRWFKVLTRRVP